MDDRAAAATIRAERAVVGTLIVRPDLLDDVLAALPRDPWRNPIHATIVETVQGLLDRREPVDPLTVHQALLAAGHATRIGGAPYLHTLVEAAMPQNVHFHARIVAEDATRRRLATLGTSLAQRAEQPDADLARIRDDAEAALAALAAGLTPPNVAEHIATLIEPTITQIERSAAGEAPALATGHVDVDRLMAGGLRPGELIIVAGRPGMGKSTIAVDWARHAALRLGQGALVFSLEMRAIDVVTRIISAEASVKLQSLRTGRLPEPDWERVAGVCHRLGSAPLWIDATSRTFGDIRQVAKTIAAKGNLGLIIIDYLQLAQGPRSETRQIEVSAMSAGAKRLAKDVDVPVVALSQLNRGAEARADRRPILSDLRESGCLTGDTWLWRADTGTPATLRELADVDGPIHVWAFDGQTFTSHPVARVWRSGVDRRVSTLRLASGRHVTGTSGHRFLTATGWREMRQLRPGDRIATVRRIPANGDTGARARRHLAALCDLGTGQVGGPTVRAVTETRLMQAARVGLPLNVSRTGNLWQVTATTPAAFTALDTQSDGPAAAWDRVVAVDDAGVADVYDATVPGVHNFVAGSIVAHNSLEQDADAVLLLHREDVGRPATTATGEAELNVVKQRNGPTGLISLAAQLHYSRFANMANDPT